MKKPKIPAGFRKPPLPGHRPFGTRGIGALSSHDSGHSRSSLSDAISHFSAADLRLNRARSATSKILPFRGGLKAT